MAHSIRTLPFVLLAFSASSARADGVDDYVKAELKRQHVPGAWVVVRRDGRVVKQKGYGLANLEDLTPVTLETRMQTGSVGKMFTAAGVMALVQEGKVRLSDSIATYFPGSPDWWKPITIHDLLTHTGGIPDYEESESLDPKKEYTEDELIKVAQGLKPAFAPGEKWSYSNTGYVVLGVLIHRISGKFYGDYLRDRIWKPNGLTTMRVISDREVIPHRAAGYDWSGGRWLNQDWVSASLNSTADGSLYATPADFIAWDKALDGYAVLPKELQELMWTSSKLKDGTPTGYGYGWEVGDYFGHRYVEHNGAWQGFTTAYVRFRDDRLSIAVFTNCSQIDTFGIARGIAARYRNMPDKERMKPITGDPAELARAKRILEDLMAGRQPREGVSGALAALPSSLLERGKANGAARGRLVGFDLMYRKPGAGGYCAYRATFEKRVVWYRLTLDGNGQFSTLANI